MHKLSPGLRKILGNVGWLMAERVLTILLSLSVGIYTIRYLGAESFGKLSYSLSFVGLFSAIAKLGMDSIIVRNIVKDERQTPEILGTAFILKLIGSTFTIILIAVTIWLLNQQSDLRWITLVVSLSLLFSSFEVIDFWFQSQVLAGAMTLFRSGQLILSSLVKILFVEFRLSLKPFVWLTLVDALFKAVGNVIIYSKHGRSLFSWKFNRSIAIQMLRDSWPLILSGIMVSIYMKIDQVMLGNMAGVEEVGNYAAAVRFSEIWYFIPGAICSSVFPAIIRARQRSEEEYYVRLQQLYDLMAWISLSIAILFAFIAKPLVIRFLGSEYIKAGEILVWHIWAGPFVFLGVVRAQWLMAENMTRFSFLATTLGGITNIWLNLVLIPSYGGTGAAIATVISYAVSVYLSSILHPAMFKTGWMLTKALLIPFRVRQNIAYLTDIQKIVSK